MMMVMVDTPVLNNYMLMIMMMMIDTPVLNNYNMMMMMIDTPVLNNFLNPHIHDDDNEKMINTPSYAVSFLLDECTLGRIHSDRVSHAAQVCGCAALCR